ncbi:fimbrial protein [Citrobacter koseri]|uniref:fimbrial protein n=1 Tax=Citrobacter koseri TaxID=545 RepID=UPI000949AC61|nr:fimbrial protein [Citrobacter koseri]HEM6801146.1 type 1 fimbrial protein [Citrobacter koseri]
MKTKKLFLATVLSVLTMSVYASDGTINFTGEITSTTCNVSTGTNGNFSVVLPTVSTTALASAGQTAGNQFFDISLTGCSGSLTNVAASFESLNNTDATNGNLVPNTAPANLQIRLADESGNQAKVGGPAVGYQPIVSGSADLRYQALYFAKAPVTDPGAVAATVSYTLNYQ